MDQAEECNAHYQVFKKHRLAQARAAIYKNRGNKIRQEWIGKEYSRVSRILWGKIIAEGEAGDDADVKWQISVIVRQSSVNAIRQLNHRALETAPKNQRHQQIQDYVSNGHLPGTAYSSANGLVCGAEISVHKYAPFGIL